MNENALDRAAARPRGIDRSSPAMLLSLAILAGVLGQYLFYRTPLGINLAIIVVAVLAVARWVRPAAARVDRLDLWVAPAAIVFALLPALRADVMLLLFDVPATLVLAAMAVVAFAGTAVTRRALDVLVLLGLVVAGRIAAGGALLLGQLPELGRPLARQSGGRVGSIGIGVALAFPFLVVFALLFASADAVFSSAITNVLDPRKWSLGEIVGRIGIAIVFAWLAGGMFVLSQRGAETPTFRVLPRLRGVLSSTAATTLLLTVLALFAFFALLQIAYLFGGLDTLNATGLTYSDYARRGFFELIAVAFIAGGLVFAVELVVARRPALYVGAAVGLVLATLVVVVSAAYRMHLYQLAYGWTEQRFYALAGIAWLGAGGIVLLVLLARGRAVWLLHAAAIAGLLVALGVNLIGPSAFIARMDLERVVDPAGLPNDARRALDAQYLVTLGDGAVPTLLEYLPRLAAADRQALGSAIRTGAFEGRDLSPAPFAGLNLDRERARQALLEAADELRTYPLDPSGRPRR